jgi:hypothetical protein
MSELQKSLSDEIDERINRRLPQMQDSIELKLIKEVDSLLKDRFESTIKLLGWAFGLVALAFAGFGVKTFFDIRDVARSAAIEEVKKKLALDDPQSEFRQDVDKVIARGLINSYYLQISRDKGQRFSSDVRLAEIDLKRLLDLVSNPRTSKKDFVDASEVMFNSAQANEDQGPARVLIAMGMASDETFRWIRDQPEKRAAIFEFTRNDKLIPTARLLIGDSKTDKELLIAAINYLGKRADKESFRQLEDLATSKDKQIKKSAIYCLASVAPDSSALREVLFPIKDDIETIVDSVRLAIDLANPRSTSFFESDPSEETRLNIASRVLQNAIAKDIFFRLISSPMGRELSLAISRRSESLGIYGVSSELLLGPPVMVLKNIIQESAENEESLKKVLRSLCLEGNERCWGVVNVRLDNGGRLVLANSIIIDGKEAPSGVSLHPESPKPDAEIIASWTDPSANSKTSKLVKMQEAKKMQFEITSVKTLTSEDKDSE